MRDAGATSGPGRRRVLAAGAAGIVSLSLPQAVAAASDPVEVLGSPGTLSFTAVGEDGFTVSWGEA